MFAFPFVVGDGETSTSVVDRLRELTDIAVRLQQAGWQLWFTVTGLAFEPPGACPDEEEVAAALSSLGIEEEFSPFPSRSQKELQEAEEEHFQLLWYKRTLVLLNRRHDLPDSVMLGLMQRVEQEYGAKATAAKSNYEWGMADGKLSALRWVLGNEWDMLDT